VWGGVGGGLGEGYVYVLVVLPGLARGECCIPKSNLLCSALLYFTMHRIDHAPNIEQGYSVHDLKLQGTGNFYFFILPIFQNAGVETIV